MPIKKAAFKHLRQSTVRTAKNKAMKSALRGLLKKTQRAIAAGDMKTAQELSHAAMKALDKAAQKGVLSKNTAARKKSRLARRLQRTKAS